MTKQVINIGTPNKGDGDPLRSAFDKINQNFTEVYSGLAAANADFSAIGGNLIPDVDNVRTLGTAQKRWNHLYVGPGSITLGDATLSISNGKITSSIGFDISGDASTILPSQSGNNGKYLTTNGSALSWASVITGATDWGSVSGKPTFATVATSGSYADLFNKPTIPTSFTNITNNGHTLSLDSSGTLQVSGGFQNANGMDFYWNAPSSNDSNHWGSFNINWGVSGFTSSFQMNKNNVLLASNTLPINLSSNSHQWAFGPSGDLTLPVGGVIKNSDGSQYGGSGSAYDQSLNTTDSPTFAGLTVEANNASVSLKGSTAILGAFNGTGYNEWSFYGDGSVNLPVLGSSDRTGTGNNLQFTRSGYQKIISTQNGTSNQHSVERLVISGGDSYTVDGFWGGEGGDVYLWAGQGEDGGDIKVDAGVSHGQNATGGTIKVRSGNADGENATGGFLELRAGNATNTDSHGGNVEVYAGNGSSTVNSGSINLRTNNATWTLDPNGITSIGNTYTKTTTSPAYEGQDFVVWTSTVANITSVKLLIQIESYEADDNTGAHTQTCEAVIAARGWIQSLYGPGEEPVMSVYGVVHTSNNPLATFTVRRNSTTNKIEVLSRNTSTSEYTGFVRIHSVEIVSNNI